VIKEECDEFDIINRINIENKKIEPENVEVKDILSLKFPSN
jgi:hypothetical protein